MANWLGKSTRKPTGGRLRPHRGKRKSEISRELTETKVGERKAKKIKTRGGHSKTVLLHAEHANVFVPKTKKSKKVKILSVVENLANPHFVRRNVITKGAVLETEIGNVKVTSRPGEDGAINAVLIE